MIKVIHHMRDMEMNDRSRIRNRIRTRDSESLCEFLSHNGSAFC